VHGWFALHDHLSSASPVVTFPGVADRSGARPTFRWLDFRSHELKPFENRHNALLLFDPQWNVCWSRWGEDASARQATPEKDLLPGPYTLVVKFQERRSFGDVIVDRESSTAVPFEVSSAPTK
jgi:hypothetical protein